MALHSIDKDRRLYTVKETYGYSCLGFDVLDRRARILAAELEEPWQERKGTKKAFKYWEQLLEKGRDRNKRTGWRSTACMTPQLWGREGQRVEVVTTYGETRRFWVGKSTGWMPCHLEILKSNSSGGGAADIEYKSVKLIKWRR